MPNFLINMAAKLGGIGTLWGFLDGKKTKIAGVAGLLSGAAGVLGQLLPLLEKHDAAALLAFAKGLPNDPAWMMAVGGLAALGLGHKGDKAIEAASAPADSPKP